MPFRRLLLTLDMIKFEHSVFALPFALTGALLAFRDGGVRDGRNWRKLVWIVVAMVGARIGGHGVQPPGGRRIDAPQSAHQDAAPAGRTALARLRLGLRRGVVAGVFCGRLGA